MQPPRTRPALPLTWTIALRDTPGRHATGDYTSLAWYSAIIGPTASQLLWRMANWQPNEPADAETLAQLIGVKPAGIYHQLQRLDDRDYISIDRITDTITVNTRLPTISTARRQQRSDTWRQGYEQWLTANRADYEQWLAANQ